MNLVPRRRLAFHSVKDEDALSDGNADDSVTDEDVPMASGGARATCHYRCVNGRDDELSDVNMDEGLAAEDMPKESRLAFATCHHRCDKTRNNESNDNMDKDITYEHVSVVPRRGLATHHRGGVSGGDDKANGSVNEDLTDEDVAWDPLFSDSRGVMKAMYNGASDDSIDKDLLDEHVSAQKQQATDCSPSDDEHGFGETKDNAEELHIPNQEGDFYEEVKITDGAGEPLMPRSLLDLAVEDIVQEGSEQGQFLWQRFKKAAANRHLFTCKAVINSWLAEGNVASRPAIIYTIIVFRSWKKNKRALEVSDWVMTEKPFELIEMDYAIRMDLIGKIDGVKKASRYYTDIPKPFQTTMVHSVLLAAYVEKNMEKCAEKLLSRAKQLGLSQQVFLYNQLMLFYKGRGKISTVADILKDMDEHGVDADLYTYNIILDLRARKGDIAGMRNVWKMLGKDKKLKPDAASYAILARGYINAGLHGKAESAIKQVESSPFGRKQMTYRWLLKLYAQLGRADDLERVWDLLTHVSKACVDNYSIMIESLGKAGEIERAEEMFKEVVDKLGIKRVHQYNALLSVYLSHGMIQKAENLVKQMSDSFNPGSSTYHRLIELYAKTGNEKKVMETFRKAQEASKTFSSHKPWYASYLTILEMFGEKGDVENAEIIIKDLRAARYPCGYNMYNALLKAYVKANRTPYGFIDRMRADGAIPNSHIRSELYKVDGT